MIADTVPETADRYAVNLIVHGSHGHGSIYKAVLGSSTDAVFRRTTCPVMIVPAPGHV